MENTLFSATDPQWQKIGRMLQEGKHFGLDGALARARESVEPMARLGDVLAMMFMANIYYTLMGSAAANGGLFGKIQAVEFLRAACKWAAMAFMTDTAVDTLKGAVAVTDVRLHTKQNAGKLGYGHLHVLMACNAQWAMQIRRRLRLSQAKEKEIVEECYIALRHAPEENLRMLGMQTYFDLNKEDGGNTKVESCRREMTKYVAEKFPALMSKAPAEVDLGLVQVVCRLARSLGEFQVAINLGYRFNLLDQVNKAEAGT